MDISHVTIDQPGAEDCLAHLQAAAEWCERAGMIAAWATLLGIADDLRERIEEPRAG